MGEARDRENGQASKIEAEGPPMPNDVLYRESLRSAIKWLFTASGLCYGAMFGLILYFWQRSPTIPDPASGRVVPQFDKLHDRYVYLTRIQDHSILAFQLVGMACLLFCIIVDFRLKKLDTRSTRELERSED